MKVGYFVAILTRVHTSVLVYSELQCRVLFAFIKV